MKRDMNLIREILIELYNSDKPIMYTPTDGSSPELRYNARLLIDGGYVVGRAVKWDNGGYIEIALEELTWEGQDLLAAIIENIVWNRISSGYRYLTIDALKSIASDIGKSLTKSVIDLP